MIFLLESNVFFYPCLYQIYVKLHNCLRNRLFFNQLINTTLIHINTFNNYVD